MQFIRGLLNVKGDEHHRLIHEGDVVESPGVESEFGVNDGKMVVAESIDLIEVESIGGDEVEG